MDPSLYTFHLSSNKGSKGNVHILENAERGTSLMIAQRELLGRECDHTSLLICQRTKIARRFITKVSEKKCH